MQSIHIATLIIIVANVLISMKALNDFSFFEKYKFNIAAIRRGEQIRMFSSAFLHADFVHLFFNMITLYFFADVVIDTLGVPRFLIIYVISLIVGNLLSFYFHKDEYHYSAVGASGAVMGVIYAAILIHPEGELLLFYALRIPAWMFGLGYLLFSIYGMKARLGNIGHDAHFGGAVAGYLLTLLFYPSVFDDKLIYVILLAVPIVILLVMYRTGKIY
ncbi:rhomboid family intramembrane serine protease [Aureisphaera galaxeae]|uniref:rhomboid family intramembrane serine protease n=1 Tax=Aureisphaera galaxeae TaxID=1538023 RepID=UPI00234FE49B|nr:rhomboid family intramembrane serine protease [Aureisphaera galaxeae]MDC8004609.1 rhomboid family intramembrane serine protease [Aureisphaera galaxeae]